MSFPSVPEGYFDQERWLFYGLPCLVLLGLTVFTLVKLALSDRAQRPMWMAQVGDQFHLPLVFYGAVLVLWFIWPPSFARLDRWLPQAAITWLFVIARLTLFGERWTSGTTARHPPTYIMGYLTLGVVILATVLIGGLAVLVLLPIWFVMLAGG